MSDGFKGLFYIFKHFIKKCLFFLQIDLIGTSAYDVIHEEDHQKFHDLLCSAFQKSTQEYIKNMMEFDGIFYNKIISYYYDMFYYLNDCFDYFYQVIIIIKFPPIISHLLLAMSFVEMDRKRKQGFVSLFIRMKNTLLKKSNSTTKSSNYKVC